MSNIGASQTQVCSQAGSLAAGKSVCHHRPEAGTDRFVRESTARMQSASTKIDYSASGSQESILMMRTPLARRSSTFAAPTLAIDE